MFNRARIEFWVLLLLATASTCVFWLTDLDYQAAAWFYVPENANQNWPYQDWWLFSVLYDYAFQFILGLGLLALGVYLSGFFYPRSRRFQRQALYIVLVVVIGPGLVVNLVFKDHWGRPRPLHIEQFGGKYSYVPPLQLGHTTDKSFVCGHCSVGYVFFVLYFLSQQHKLLFFLLPVFLGWTLGITRMSAGGHFVSDILWSGYLVFLVAFAVYYGWYLRVPPLKPETKAK